MKRRNFIAGFGAAISMGSFSANAQGIRKPAKIGFLGLGSAAVAKKRIDALRLGLSDLGYIDQRDYVIDAREGGGDYTRLDAIGAELVRSGPDVLVTQATPGTAALKRATKTIPIVMVSGDAVATGLIDSLNRPGGNVTGMTFFSPELIAKRLELLKEAAPLIENVGMLASATNPVTKGVLHASDVMAQSLSLKLHPVLVRASGDFAPAFSTFAGNNVGGIVVQDEPMIIANAKLIADFATKQRLLSVGFLELIQQGGLVAYSIDFGELYRHAARYVVKILQGTKPEDLPVEEPTKFELAINLRAAKALGFELPATLLARADKVIE